MAHLQHACTHCGVPTVSGSCFECKQCKNFQLCDKCYETEQKLEDTERYPINQKDKHKLYQGWRCEVCADYTLRNEKGRSHLAALKVKKEKVLLLGASLLATVLFLAACRFPRFIVKANHIYGYDIRDSTITSSFILLNSIGFVVSVAIVISILHSFPLKPWPQISVFMFFVTYMSLIMEISARESSLVLVLSVPLLLLAAAGKLCN